MRSRAAAVLLGLLALMAVFAPVIAPHDAGARFADSVDAPPTPIRIVADGALTWPYFHPWHLADRLEARYDEDAVHARAADVFRGRPAGERSRAIR